jgi:hypothetical protein
MFSFASQMLAHAGVGMRYGTDDAVIAELLLRRSYPHLREMFAEFQTLKRHPIEDSIRLDFRGGLRDGLLALGKINKINTFSFCSSSNIPRIWKGLCVFSYFTSYSLIM